MKVLLSRWQFGVTITYHFLFVPLTIGLALLMAVMQVLAYRRQDETWERLRGAAVTYPGRPWLWLAGCYQQGGAFGSPSRRTHQPP